MQAATAAINCKSSPRISRENNGNRECRCCLSLGQHSHNFGKTESEILMENLNVFLVEDARLPQFICSSCIKLLYEIKIFRKTVLTTEKELMQRIDEAPISLQSTAMDTGKVLQSSHSDPLEIVPDSVKVKSEENSCDDVPEMSCADDEDGLLHTGPDVRALMSQVKTEDIDVHENPLVYLPENVLQSLQGDPLEINPNSAEVMSEDSDSSDSERTWTADDMEFSDIELNEKELMSEVKKCDGDIPQDVHVHWKGKEMPPPKPPLKRGRTFKWRQVEEIPTYKTYLKPGCSYVKIGERYRVAKNSTKIKANMIMILQNSTVIPFNLKSANCLKCFYCEHTYSLFKNLKQHCQISHSNPPSDYTIFVELQARQTTIIHVDITNLKCKLCNKTIASIDKLVQHLINVHKKTYYTDINSDVNVSSHGVIGYKLDKGNLKCHLCQTEFRFLKYLINHMDEHYGCYSCPKCDKKFTTSIRRNQHCRTHVKTEIKCTDCNSVFRSKQAMLIHRNSKHATSIFQESPKMIKCAECPEMFLATRPILRYKHMEKQHGIKRPVYKCVNCGTIYKTIHGLNQHTRSAHVRKNEIMCDICGYVTTDKSYMNIHLEHHKGIRKFECDYCQKKFRTKASLRMHFRGHFNDKRFACSLCDAAFIQKHCLKSHIKSKHPNSGVVLTLSKSKKS